MTPLKLESGTSSHAKPVALQSPHLQGRRREPQYALPLLTLNGERRWEASKPVWDNGAEQTSLIDTKTVKTLAPYWGALMAPVPPFAYRYPCSADCRGTDVARGGTLAQSAL